MEPYTMQIVLASCYRNYHVYGKFRTRVCAKAYYNNVACRPVARRYCTTGVARQRHANNNRGMMFSAWFAKQQMNSNRLRVSRCYKQVNWSNELVVRQSLIGEKVSKEAEVIVGIHHEATTGEDTAA
jgi:hypothetical protein